VPLRDVGTVRALLGDIDSQIQRAITDRRASEQESYAGIVEKDAAQMEELIEAYSKTKLVPAEVAALEDYRSDWPKYVETFRTMLEQTANGDRAAATALYYRSAAPLYAQVDAHLAEIGTINDREAKRLNAQIGEAYRSGRTLLIMLLVVSIAIGLGVALAISRGIERGVRAILERLASLRDRDVSELETGLRALAGGNLAREVEPATEPIERRSSDEIGDVAVAVEAIRARTVESITAYNETRAGLGAMITQVTSTAGSISSASQEMATTSDEASRAVEEIAHAVGDLAQGAERQVRSAEAARVAVETMVESTRSSLRDARETAEAAQRARALALEGAGAVDGAGAAMDTMRTSATDATQAIRELGEKSAEIGGIVETITGIAEQTNLLALNAAIEAARAGEQGRGFAVVAEEVRKLAEESQTAAATIAELIRDIQSGTQRAVGAVERGAADTEQGAATVEHARNAFAAIQAAIDEVSSRNEQIAAAVGRVAESSDSLGGNITDVASVAEQSSASTEQVSASTQQTSASAQQIAGTAQSLASTAEELDALVGRFTLDS
jgi:methyl-accepting chemotaxis protein